MSEFSKVDIARKVESELRAALLQRTVMNKVVTEEKEYEKKQSDERSRDRVRSEEGKAGSEQQASALESSIRWDFLRSQEGQGEIDRMLFSRDDYFRVATNLHQEFNDFFDKYLSFRRKELSKPKSSQPQDDLAVKAKSQLTRKQLQAIEDLPSQYDPRYRFNFSILTPHAAVNDTSHQTSSLRAPKSALSPEELSEARRALVMFEDFRQRRSIKRIAKLREDQRALPIFAFKEQIIAAVRNNPVVLIAGDTGCGKSTQVPDRRRTLNDSSTVATRRLKTRIFRKTRLFRLKRRVFSRDEARLAPGEARQGGVKQRLCMSAGVRESERHAARPTLAGIRVPSRRRTAAPRRPRDARGGGRCRST